MCILYLEKLWNVASNHNKLLEFMSWRVYYMDFGAEDVVAPKMVKVWGRKWPKVKNIYIARGGFDGFIYRYCGTIKNNNHRVVVVVNLLTTLRWYDKRPSEIIIRLCDINRVVFGWFRNLDYFSSSGLIAIQP